MSQPLYKKSLAAQKLKTKPFIGFIDIDGSFVYEKPSKKSEWKREYAARKKIRDYIQTNGVLASITMRTPALMLTEASYRKALANGYREPEPLLGFDTNEKRVWQSQETLDEFSQVLDWDIISGIGSGILVKTSDGYCVDHTYEQKLGVSPSWRAEAMKLLQAIDKNGDVLSLLAPIEFEEKYRNREVDISPRPYRVQLDFRGSQGLKMKREVARRIIEIRRKGSREMRNFARNIVLQDESNPQEDTFTLYLIPKRGTKDRAMDHILKSVADAAEVQTNDLEILYAGDTMTDFRAGFVGGVDADVTFLLVGGSRMTPYLYGDKKGKSFAGESLAWIQHKLTHEISPGVFTFEGTLGKTRTVIIGDIAFPGTHGPETIAAWLESREEKVQKNRLI